MERTVLYKVTFSPAKRSGNTDTRPITIATVNAVEDNEAFTAYHLDHHGGGRHIVPDYEAIRAALPHYHRKAYDRAMSWWFPASLATPIQGFVDPNNSATRGLRDAKGRSLGTLYATPYLYSRGTKEG